MVQPAEAIESQKDVTGGGHVRQDAAHFVRVTFCEPDVFGNHGVLAPKVLEIRPVDVAVEDFDGQGEDDDEEPEE